MKYRYVTAGLRNLKSFFETNKHTKKPETTTYLQSLYDPCYPITYKDNGKLQ